MNDGDLQFVAETLLLTIESGDQDGLEIMFAWGIEIMDGDPNAFLETMRSMLIAREKKEAVSILEEYAATLFSKK